MVLLIKHQNHKVAMVHQFSTRTIMNQRECQQKDKKMLNTSRIIKVLRNLQKMKPQLLLMPVKAKSKKIKITKKSWKLQRNEKQLMLRFSHQWLQLRPKRNWKNPIRL